MRSISGCHPTHLIGVMIPCIPTIQEAPLHYRALQRFIRISTTYIHAVITPGSNCRLSELVNEYLECRYVLPYLTTCRFTNSGDRRIQMRMVRGAFAGKVHCGWRTMVSSRGTESHTAYSWKKSPLFTAIIKPHKPVNISRWMKSMMAEAGVNIPKFKAHSIRAVGTSAAAKVGVPIKLIQTYTCIHLRQPLQKIHVYRFKAPCTHLL